MARSNIDTHSDLVGTFKFIYRVRSSERNPKEVPEAQGWSPYKAKDFLVKEGVSTGFYNRLFEEEWSASSPMEEFGDGVIRDNIAYYLEGSEDVAFVLMLKVNVNDAVRSRQACDILKRRAEVLINSSLGQPLSKKMKSAISGCESYSERYGNKIVSLVVESWRNHSFDGFDLKFSISTI